MHYNSNGDISDSWELTATYSAPRQDKSRPCWRSTWQEVIADSLENNNPDFQGRQERFPPYTDLSRIHSTPTESIFKPFCQTSVLILSVDTRAASTASRKCQKKASFEWAWIYLGNYRKENPVLLARVEVKMNGISIYYQGTMI